MRIFASSKTTAKATPEALRDDMDAEVAVGKRLFEQGLIVQAYMDPSYTDTYMILEAASIADAKASFDTYPLVRAGLIVYEFTPVVGMPAVAQSLQERNQPQPGWWPADPDA